MKSSREEQALEALDTSTHDTSVRTYGIHYTYILSFALICRHVQFTFGLEILIQVLSRRLPDQTGEKMAC